MENLRQMEPDHILNSLEGLMDFALESPEFRSSNYVFSSVPSSWLLRPAPQSQIGRFLRRTRHRMWGWGIIALLRQEEGISMVVSLTTSC